MSSLLWCLLSLAGLLAVGVGIMAGADAEGRAGSLLWLVPAGSVLALVAIFVLVIRAGRFFCLWG